MAKNIDEAPLIPKLRKAQLILTQKNRIDRSDVGTGDIAVFVDIAINDVAAVIV